MVCKYCGRDISNKLSKNRITCYYSDCKRLRKRIQHQNDKSNEVYNIRRRIRSRFTQALKHQQLYKNRTLMQYGISIRDIIEHIGPCPGNRTDYHIDHIKPLSLFDLRNEEEIRKAFAPKNHQWLRAEENLSKNNKFNS